MTAMIKMCCLSWFLTLDVAVKVFCSELLNEVYISTRYHHEDFVSVEITDFQSCRHLCRVHITCEAVNFSRRGNICRLIHKLVWDDDDFILEQKAGVITWLKTSQNEADDDTVCQPQDQRDYCKTYCGKHYAFLNGDLFNGNMVEAGSKLLCDRCFSSSSPPSKVKVTGICTNEGEWVFTDERCSNNECEGGITNDGNYTRYRVYNTETNFGLAFQACIAIDAALMKVTTYDRLQFYVDVIKALDNKAGGYWIDANDVGGSWQTSDGQDISADVINHHTDGEACARIHTANYRVYNRECFRSYGFICEF